MNYIVRWFKDHQWFHTEQAARKWAADEVAAWVAGSVENPEYRVIYQPTGQILHTYPAHKRAKRGHYE